MAATATDDIIKQIILRLREEVEGAGVIAKEAETIKKSCASTVKATSGVFKAGQILSKGLGIAGAALAGVGSPVVGLGKMMVNTSKDFLALTNATGQGSSAIDQLKTDYAAFQQSAQATGNSVVVSMQDAAKALSSFANQGWAQFRIAGEKGGGEFVAGLMNTLEKGTGDTEAAIKMMNDLAGAMAKQGMGTLMQFQNDMKAAGGDMIKQAQAVAKYSWVDPQIIQQAIAAMVTAQQVAEGVAPPEVMMASKWNELTKMISSVVDNIKAGFLAAFGGETSGLIKDVVDWIKDLSTNVNVARDWFIRLKTTAINVFKALRHPIDAVFGDIKWERPEEEIAKLNEKQAEAKKRADEIATASKSIVTENMKSFAAVKDIEEKTKNWKAGLDAATGSMNAVADIAAKIGPSFQIAGQSFQQFMASSSADIKYMSAHMKQAGEDQIKQMQGVIARSKLAEEELKIMQATGQVDEERKKNLEAQVMTMDGMSETYKKIREGAGMVAQAENDRINAVEQSTKQLEGQKHLLDTYGSQVEKLKGISQATFGSPGLSIEYIRMGNELLEKSKQNIIAQMKAQEEAIKQQYGPQEALVKIDEMRAKKQDEMLGIQQKQMENLKELREGYLDSITSMMFGAGRFEKIIVTQQKNVAKAMETDIAAKTARLGVVGDKALQSDVKSVRFGAGGYGDLKDAAGAKFSQQDTIQQSGERIKNESDNFSRDTAQASLDIVAAGRGIANAGINFSKTLENAGLSNKSLKSGAVAGGTNPDIVGGGIADAGNKGQTMSPRAGTPSASGSNTPLGGDTAAKFIRAGELLIAAGNELKEETSSHSVSRGVGSIPGQ